MPGCVEEAQGYSGSECLPAWALAVCVAFSGAVVVQALSQSTITESESYNTSVARGTDPEAAQRTTVGDDVELARAISDGGLLPVGSETVEPRITRVYDVSKHH